MPFTCEPDSARGQTCTPGTGRERRRAWIAPRAVSARAEHNNESVDTVLERVTAMNMSEAAATQRAVADAALSSEAAEIERWRALVAEVGASIAAPLTCALERIVSLAASGRIDRNGLRALREDVERARQIGIQSQQLARLASGRVRQLQERIELVDLLSGMLQHRAREIQAKGLQVRQGAARPTEVLADASLLFTLLNTLLSWAIEGARSTIDLGVEHSPWPARARLLCRFEHGSAAPSGNGAASSTLDSMHWRLLEHVAQALGVAVERRSDSGITTLALAFPRTVSEALDGMSAIEMDDGFAPSMNGKPLAGSHVLVLAQRKEVRAEIRDAVRNMGLIIDFVSSVDEAAAFCRDGLPHAIVVESLLCGERFDALRNEIAAEVPQFVFVEVIEDGRAFEMSGFTPASMARVGRDALAQSLPSVLLFELSRDGA